MVTEFTHPELGQMVESFGGYYIPQQEEILRYKGRDVLCISGYACIETS